MRTRVTIFLAGLAVGGLIQPAFRAGTAQPPGAAPATPPAPVLPKSTLPDTGLALPAGPGVPPGGGGYVVGTVDELLGALERVRADRAKEVADHAKRMDVLRVQEAEVVRSVERRLAEQEDRLRGQRDRLRKLVGDRSDPPPAAPAVPDLPASPVPDRGT